jgi:hypothetical protein
VVRDAAAAEDRSILLASCRDRRGPRKALRVSRYLGLPTAEPHVRFSVWNEEGVAEGAVSLDEEEASRLAGFILARVGSAPDTGGWLRVIVSQVRAEISAGRGRRSDSAHR